MLFICFRVKPVFAAFYLSLPTKIEAIRAGSNNIKGVVLMGRSRRPIPEHLPEKLFYIRLHLALTQEQMVRRLQAELDEDERIPLFSGHISEYERGEREPPLKVLLQYARLGQMPLEVLVDDRMSPPGEYVHYKIMGINTLEQRKKMKT